MSELLPYGRQSIDDDDVEAVMRVLRGDWLTQGPTIGEFERAFASAVGATHAVAVNSGTAALHAAVHALELGPGDEVVVPPLTFAATANAVVYAGARPVFADIHPDTLTLDPRAVERVLGERTRAVIAVDYAGLPADYEGLRALTEPRRIALVADACHALGGQVGGTPVGRLAQLSAFSFHPVKHIATGEGGMVTTENASWAERMREFRSHGITRDPARFLPEPGEERGPWYYEMRELGYNYRMPDLLAALGLSQLGKLERFLERRREIASRYDEAFAPLQRLRPAQRSRDGHAFHLYPVWIDFPACGRTRTEVIGDLRVRGVGSQVHYIPVHLHPYYRERHGTGPGLCPVAESAYAGLLSLPMYPALSDADVERVIAAVCDLIG